MSQITHFCSVKLVAWKSGCVKFLTNIMSELSTSVIITWETCRTKKHCRSPGYKPSSCQSPSLSSPSLPLPAVSSHSSSLQTSRLLIEDFIGQSKKAIFGKLNDYCNCTSVPARPVCTTTHSQGPVNCAGKLRGRRGPTIYCSLSKTLTNSPRYLLFLSD